MKTYQRMMRRNSTFLRCSRNCGKILAAATMTVYIGCAAQRTNEVIVMGMIHDGHKTSERYGIDDIKRMVRAIDPDYILCEIPPERLDTALKEFRTSGKIEEPRVRRFPEYVEAIIPLSNEMEFAIVPCAGWTLSMAKDRRDKLEEWKTTRAQETADVERAEEAADNEIERRGWSDDPNGIHTDAYDEIVKRGLEPYNRLFNDDLGAGGWDHINAAHYALIEAALDEHRGSGKRFLITFGAWHKYWFLEQLRKRTDISLKKPQDFMLD